MAEHIELQLQLPGVPPVIGVEQRDEITPDEPDRVVARCGDTRVALIHVANAWLVVIARAYELCGVIAGPVVEHDDLELVMGLGECTVDRTGHAVRAIVRRDDYADTFAHGLTE